jgi:hypothetical protein
MIFIQCIVTQHSLDNTSIPTTVRDSALQVQKLGKFMRYYELSISASHSLHQCFSYRDEFVTVKRFSVSKMLMAWSAIQLLINHCQKHLCSQFIMLNMKHISAYIWNSCGLKFLFIHLFSNFS